MVRAGKTRLIGSDSDLRPKYSGIDAIKYDAIVCPYCGYASLSRFLEISQTDRLSLLQVL